MIDQLQILQANVNKSSSVCHSLSMTLSGRLHTSPDFRTTGDTRSIFHSNWNTIFPTMQDKTTNNKVACFRSMIWVNKNQKARQVAIDHSDLTAVYAQVGKRYLFIASFTSLAIQTDQKQMKKSLDPA